MKDHRLRAPATDGALLAVPPLAEVGRPVSAETARRLAAWDHDFQGRRAGRLRDLVRREVIAAARQFLTRARPRRPGVPARPDGASTTPLVVTGHQPELFHPASGSRTSPRPRSPGPTAAWG